MFDFSVHEYDEDGDIFEAGIYLHFGDTRIKIAETLAEFQHFASEANRVCAEIAQNYDI